MVQKIINLKIYLLCSAGIKRISATETNLSMNNMGAGNKSPVQRGFFKNSAGDLLPASRFLGRLYNFCNFVLIFSLM